MQPQPPQSAAEQPTCHRVRLDSSGRVLLPLGTRTRLGLHQGDELYLTEDEHGCRLRTLDQLVQELQDFVAQHVPLGVSLADELADDRRADAARE